MDWQIKTLASSHYPALGNWACFLQVQFIAMRRYTTIDWKTVWARSFAHTVTKTSYPRLDCLKNIPLYHHVRTGTAQKIIAHFFIFIIHLVEYSAMPLTNLFLCQNSVVYEKITGYQIGGVERLVTVIWFLTQNWKVWIRRRNLIHVPCFQPFSTSSLMVKRLFVRTRWSSRRWGAWPFSKWVTIRKVESFPSITSH